MKKGLQNRLGAKILINLIVDTTKPILKWALHESPFLRQITIDY